MLLLLLFFVVDDSFQNQIDNLIEETGCISSIQCYYDATTLKQNTNLWYYTTFSIFKLYL